MIEKNLSTLKINKLTKEQFEQALAQNRIQSDQLYMVADESSGEGQYLPLTGGVLTGDDGATIGLYPSSDDGTVNEPSIEISNSAGDYANISPASIGLQYGNTTVYLSAEESYLEIIGVNDQSTALSPSALNIQNNAGSVNLSPSELQIQYGDTNLYASTEGGHINFYNNNANTSISPGYISVGNSDGTVTASISTTNNGKLELYSDETRYDISLSAEEGAICVSLNQDEEYCTLSPRNLILETATGSVSLDDSSIIANGAKLTFPTKTGTLALTSDLSSYFPLAGGTINGELVLNNSNEASVTNPPLTAIGYISGESGTTEVARIGAFENSPYGIVIKTDPNGTSYIQSQRFGSDTEFFNLSLNPWGGEVLVNGVKVATINDTNWLSTRLTALENSVVAVLSGTTEPTSDIGEDGDIYLVTE